jgi:hypothetical protein
MTDIEPRRFRLYAWFALLAFAALAADLITGGEYVSLMLGMVG